jgi:hypothetical protein
MRAKLNEGLAMIEAKTFENCEVLTSVSIPSTVGVIGERAFYKCSELDEVQLPNGLQVIEKEAFESCSSLENVSIPPTVTVIAEKTFRNCDMLERIEIPSTITRIDARAFEFCEKLETLEFHDGLEVIGPRAFRGCSAVTNVRIPATVISIEKKAFFQCSSLCEVRFCDGLKEIKDQAFQRCYLRKIQIPSTVTFIEDEAFDRVWIEFDSFGGEEIRTDLKEFLRDLLDKMWYITPFLLMTYNHFTQGNILARIQSLKVMTWQEEIQAKAMHIRPHKVLEFIEETLDSFENEKNWMENAAMLLDLYIRKQRMTSSNIIIPNVMSFFLPSGQSLFLFPNFAKRRKISHTSYSEVNVL